ncbi:MAG: hypothetical protein JJU08_11830 [Rhodobacteraceae bacterium]|nr:hypothetical protein [Paracoccaceae bacterium]
MFCPPEYVHIHEILDTCKRAAAALSDNDLPVSLGRSKGHNPLSAVSTRNLRKAVELQMVKITLEEYRNAAVAFSPPDKILRLSNKVVTLAKPVNHILKSNDPHARVELFYIDIRTGRVDLKNLADRISSWATWRLQGESYASFHACNMDIQRQAMKEFGEIDGWVVCFERPAIAMCEKDISELWKNAFRSNHAVQADPQVSKRKPLERVWTDTWQAFPNGKTTTWEIIEQFSGHSRRQIMRALDEYGGRERWAGSGREVGNND